MTPSLFSRFDAVTTLVPIADLRWPVVMFQARSFFLYTYVFLAVKEMGGCDCGCEKNWMDGVKFGDITQIDEMARKKKISDGFK